MKPAQYPYIAAMCITPPREVTSSDTILKYNQHNPHANKALPNPCGSIIIKCKLSTAPPTVYEVCRVVSAAVNRLAFSSAANAWNAGELRRPDKNNFLITIAQLSDCSCLGDKARYQFRFKFVLRLTPAQGAGRKSLG
ncbi:hypothetical protein RRG08_056835 [Elysia crispata]|uniref:Uncharacterized protein n=1 Tax=Elysia crispata TaxID=231223 RepID=A0AAE1ABH9_9GAST|nr:hypothetical protein RRG08_056835 [Elysia crispata]